jgi:hypothetical protein
VYLRLHARACACAVQGYPLMEGLDESKYQELLEMANKLFMGRLYGKAHQVAERGGLGWLGA